MNWLGVHFSGVGRQRRQREDSLARVKAACMGKLEQASAEQALAAESVKESVQEQTSQTRALRRVVKGVVELLHRREEKLNLRRDPS